jgi:hypothetical protein
MINRGTAALDYQIEARTVTENSPNVQHAGKELAQVLAALNSNVTRFDDLPSWGDRQMSPVRGNKIIFLLPGKP